MVANKDDDIAAIFRPEGTAGRVSRTPSVVITPSGVPDDAAAANGSTHTDETRNLASDQTNDWTAKLRACSASACSIPAKKIYFGIWVTLCVTASWVGATHCFKYLNLEQYTMERDGAVVVGVPDSNVDTTNSSENATNITTIRYQYRVSFRAPFFTTWFITNWTILFFPLHILSRACSKSGESFTDILADSLRGYRDRGFTIGRFMSRCTFFCLLWVGTNYMYILSLRILLATDVISLFATNVSFVYLLSWVILHEQFVGIRIMAVIICDTGVALLAYMDGITGSPTLAGVVLATSSAAASAVYKVLFKKMVGDATYGQVALFFTLIGMLNAAMLWPLSVALIISGLEIVDWYRLPWLVLMVSSVLTLVANLLGNFSVALTYDLFITLGLITAVPVSAALDVVLYGAQFEGMKLAGIILIAIGFFLVMFPDNWPNYITRVFRNIIQLSHNTRHSCYKLVDLHLVMPLLMTGQ